MAKVEIRITLHGYDLGVFEAELPDEAWAAALQHGSYANVLVAPAGARAPGTVFDAVGQGVQLLPLTLSQGG